MSSFRRAMRLAVIVCLALCASSCSWMLNEAFVYDVPAPQEEPASGADGSW